MIPTKTFDNVNVKISTQFFPERSKVKDSFSCLSSPVINVVNVYRVSKYRKEKSFLS